MLQPYISLDQRGCYAQFQGVPLIDQCLLELIQRPCNKGVRVVCHRLGCHIELAHARNDFLSGFSVAAGSDCEQGNCFAMRRGRHNLMRILMLSTKLLEEPHRIARMLVKPEL